MKYLHTLDRNELNALIDRENEVLEGEPEPETETKPETKTNDGDTD